MCTKFEVYMRTMKTRKAAQNVDIGVVWGRLLVHPRSSQYNHSLKRMTNSYYYENQIMLARVTAKNAGMFFFLRHSVEKKTLVAEVGVADVVRCRYDNGALGRDT